VPKVVIRIIWMSLGLSFCLTFWFGFGGRWSSASREVFGCGAEACDIGPIFGFVGAGEDGVGGGTRVSVNTKASDVPFVANVLPI